MSQRSAPSAAASATAEVSEPPRPSVEMRPSGPIPWKPETTACSPWPNFSSSASVPISRIRAVPCAPVVRIGICQPCQDRAETPSFCSMSAIRPEVTCSPEATTVSYSRAS